MINLFIDPLILARPASSADHGEFERFAESISNWDSLSKADWLSAFIWRKSAELLYTEDRYPGVGDLQTIAKRLGIKSIQARDVATIVDRLLQRVRSIEDRLGIDDLMLGENTKHTADDHFIPRTELFKKAYSELTLQVCLLVETEGQSQDDQIIASIGFPEPVRQVRSEGEIAIIESSSRTFAYPIELDGTFQTISSAQCAETLLNPIALWLRGTHTDHFFKAISLTVENLQKTMGGDLKPLRWRIGAEFLERARVAGFMNTPQKARELLRACAETILRVQLSDVHALRTGRGGGNPQRTQGIYAANRRDVDYEYHLHFWEGGGEIIIATVGVHNDFGIPNA